MASVAFLSASTPLFAQLQFTYDYNLLPHAPQSDSAQTFTYDSNGNLTRRTNRSSGAAQNFQYNPANQIEKAVESGVEYRYDTSGNRIAKIRRNTAGTITQIERYFGLIETDGTNRRKYYFFGSRRIAEKTQTGTITYHHTDHLNSATVTTNNAGGVLSRLDFYEFGALKSEEGTGGIIKYAYTGQEKDPETNLYNYNARMYSSTVGKFTTPDSLIPDLAKPQSLNRYAYVDNNPLRYDDPTGHGVGLVTGPPEDAPPGLPMTFQRAPHVYGGVSYTVGGALRPNLDVNFYRSFMAEAVRYGIDPIWAAATTIVEYGGVRTDRRASYATSYGYLPMDGTMAAEFSELSTFVNLMGNANQVGIDGLSLAYSVNKKGDGTDIKGINHRIQYGPVGSSLRRRHEPLQDPLNVASFTLGQVVQKRILHYADVGLSRNMSDRAAVEFGLQAYNGYGYLDGESSASHPASIAAQLPHVKGSDFPIYGQDVFKIMQDLMSNDSFSSLLPCSASTPIWDKVQAASGDK